MAIDIREHTERFLDEPLEQANTDASDTPVAHSRDVYERINEILGYDILQVSLMVEGYRELAGEMQSISESTLAAGFEVLPPE